MKTIRLFLSTVLCVWCLFFSSINEANVSVHSDKLLASERLAAINQIAQYIDSSYVLPDVGTDVVAALKSAQNIGRFCHINSKKQFIEEIGQFLREQSKDGHLGLTFMRSDKKVTHVLQEHDEKRINNFALEQAKVLPGNIGYFKLNKFHPNEQAKQIASFGLNFLSNTSHLIIDLRQSTGGSMELVTYLVSHFIQKDIHLWDIYERDELAYRVHSHAVDREPQLLSIPLTILTAKTSISAAEFFAYTLQHLGRARIVGEQTEGLAHATGARKVNDWLVLRLPLMRPVNPITNTNWEQVGVKADKEIAKELALDWVLNTL
ncbi:interphotoreceptor retinoid-binding protein [Pseudoalteromonas sp. A25]|uniref:S41 family peptidase n=1 Tax=Pseudoalteromonas sp. A25 TaxID=116092 RepID=UPI001260A6FF|nr:S41 family peptidase [Pseudoalteromonas sp. A25]BBN83509.1 interphotoreceptor retinoid-binding protein [Pseudoalteromonas sp. A25]